MSILLPGLPGLGEQPAPGALATPEDIAYRKRLALALQQEATSAAPVQHWTQALARVLQGAVGGWSASQADRDTALARQKATDAFSSAFGSPEAPSAPSAPTSAPGTPSAQPSAPGGQRVTSYSPQKGGDQMEGGYEAARPGPDGKALVRTLEDYRSGQAPYVTVAGNPAFYGKEYTIPQVSYTANGQRYTLSNVPAVVHDTGGAFKNAPEGRFDLPVGRDLGPADTNQGFNGVQFQPKGVQVASAGPMAYAPSGPSLPGAPALPPGADPIPPRPTGVPGAPTAQPALPGAPPAAALQQQAQAAPAPQPAMPQTPAGPNALQMRAMKILMDPNVSPWLNETQRALLLQQAKPGEFGFQTLPDGTIIRTDPKTGTVAPIYQAPTKSQFTEIGQDQYGNKQYGFVNPEKGTVTPAQAQAAPSAPAIVGQEPVVPPPPPGVDPKKWREEYTKNAVERSSPANPQQTTELRKEVQQLPSYKNYAQAAPVYKSMFETAGRNTRASDLNLVYGLGKIMDPNSVVREGEMVMVKNAANLPDWLVSTINSLATGQSAMDPKLRTQVLQEAYGRMKEYEAMLNTDLGQYRGIAGRRGIDERDVLPAMPTFEPWQPAKPASGQLEPAPQSAAPVAQPTAAPRAPNYAPGGGPSDPDAAGWIEVSPGVRIRQKAQ